MKEWNIVITVRYGHYHQACDALSQYAIVYETEFYNVLLLYVPDIASFLDSLLKNAQDDPDFLIPFGRIVPVSHSFTFQEVSELERKAKEVINSFLPQLENKTFHVRMHRRGFKGRFSSPIEERFLDECILQQTETVNKPAKLDFEDPDIIIALETIGQHAGLSCWTRSERQRYPFLKLD